MFEHSVDKVNCLFHELKIGLVLISRYFHLFVYKISMLDQIPIDVIKNWGCHTLHKFKIKMGMAGSIFEPQSPNLVKIHTFKDFSAVNLKNGLGI